MGGGKGLRWWRGPPWALEGWRAHHVVGLLGASGLIFGMCELMLLRLADPALPEADTVRTVAYAIAAGIVAVLVSQTHSEVALH